MGAAENAERTALYRLYDGDGRLLYVGIAKDPEKRLRAHRWGPDRADWRHDIATQSVEWRDTREEAEAAEIAAIRSELPLHNRRHHPAYDDAPWSSRSRRARKPAPPVIIHPSTASWG